MEPPNDNDDTREPPATAGTDALRALIGSLAGPGAPRDGLAGQTRALIELVEANRARLEALRDGTPALSRRVEFRLPPPQVPDPEAGLE
jgi:hypothetical protein